MKSKYKRYNIYLVDEFKKTLLTSIQKDISPRTEAMFYRGWYLMKVKRNNINKAMRRLQIFKLRNIEIDSIVDKVTTLEYKEHNNV